MTFEQRGSNIPNLHDLSVVNIITGATGEYI